MKQIRILEDRHQSANFGAPDNFHLYVTTMEEINVQDDILSIPIDKFKDSYVPVFDLTSMEGATDCFLCPK